MIRIKMHISKLFMIQVKLTSFTHVYETIKLISFTSSIIILKQKDFLKADWLMDECIIGMNTYENQLNMNPMNLLRMNSSIYV